MATRRLSMFDYASQTNKLWQGEQNRGQAGGQSAEGETFGNVPGQATPGAPGSETVGSPPVRPPVPDVIPDNSSESGISADVPQDLTRDPYIHLQAGQYIPGYDRMKSAAFAAGVASQNAARRGSTVTLVSPTSQSTSLLYRRHSSLGRELAEAQTLHNSTMLPK